MPDLAKETPGGESLPKSAPPSKPAAKNAPYAPPLSAEQVDAMLALLEPKALGEAGVFERAHPEVRAYQQLAGALRTVKKFL